MDNKNEMRKCGPYLVCRDARIIDTRTAKTIKKHVRKGKCFVGLKMKTGDICTYYRLHRLLYMLFINSGISRYEYVIPIDGNYLNLELNNWVLCSASEYHKKKTPSKRKKKVSPELETTILQLHETGDSFRKIASQFNISTFTIHKIVNGKYH